VRALAKVYESLLAGGARLLDGDLARLFTARHRAGMFDHTFKCTLDFGLGFLIDSKQYAGEHAYGYGAHASSEAFGHSGNQSSCAFADPVHGLVVAWVCTGMPGDARHDARQRAINAAVYEDLGLA
jgi:CubicO group peptidase (beta-lactamase class C family)